MKRLTCSLYLLFATVFATSLSAGCSACKDYAEIFAAHIETMDYLDVQQDAQVISFSGTPGMGKSAVARVLEEELQAVRISSDDVRRMLRDYGYEPDRLSGNAVYTPLQVYLMYALSRIHKEYTNHCFILDSSVDRKYLSLAELTAAMNYPLFIIRLDCPRELAEERIVATRANPEDYLKHMDSWFADYEAFPLRRADYILDTSGSLSDLPIDDLVETIKVN